MMKIKLMPMLVGAIAFGAIATPLVVNAQANLSAQPLLAQAGQRQERQGKWERLNLTDAQKAQMRQIKEEARVQMRAILTPEQQAKLDAAMQNGQRGDRQAWKEIKDSLSDEQKAQMRELMQQQKSRMDAILTEEQKQQLQEMRQNWEQKRQQRQQTNQ